MYNFWMSRPIVLQLIWLSQEDLHLAWSNFSSFDFPSFKDCICAFETPHQMSLQILLSAEHSVPCNQIQCFNSLMHKHMHKQHQFLQVLHKSILWHLFELLLRQMWKRSDEKSIKYKEQGSILLYLTQSTLHLLFQPLARQCFSQYPPLPKREQSLIQKKKDSRGNSQGN